MNHSARETTQAHQQQMQHMQRNNMTSNCKRTKPLAMGDHLLPGRIFLNNSNASLSFSTFVVSARQTPPGLASPCTKPPIPSSSSARSSSRSPPGLSRTSRGHHGHPARANISCSCISSCKAHSFVFFFSVFSQLPVRTQHGPCAMLKLHNKYTTD